MRTELWDDSAKLSKRYEILKSRLLKQGVKKMTDLRKAAIELLKSAPDHITEHWPELDEVGKALAQPEQDHLSDAMSVLADVNADLIAGAKPAQPEQEPVAKFHVEHRTNACSEVCDIDRKVYATCAWSEGAGKRAQHICDLLNADFAKTEQEPVSGMDECHRSWLEKINKPKTLADYAPEYPAPPRKPWQSLTDEEMEKATRMSVDELLDHIYENGTTTEGVSYLVNRITRAIEAALRSKNNG